MKMPDEYFKNVAFIIHQTKDNTFKFLSGAIGKPPLDPAIFNAKPLEIINIFEYITPNDLKLYRSNPSANSCFGCKKDKTVEIRIMRTSDNCSFAVGR